MIETAESNLHIPLFEILNSISCLALLFYLLAIAIVLPHKGVWFTRFIIWALAFFLCLQVISPWAEWTPYTSWNSSLLHVFFFIAILLKRKQLIDLIRREYGVPEPKSEPLDLVLKTETN